MALGHGFIDVETWTETAFSEVFLVEWRTHGRVVSHQGGFSANGLS